MRAYVRFIWGDDDVVDLCPGDLIGRLWSAGLRIDDARVSEAHALVSLRGAQLKLLALRGVLAVDGKRVSEVVLEPGVEVFFAKDLSLEVAAVEIPDTALALQAPGLLPQTLAASVYSVVTRPAAGLVPRNDPAAQAHIWSTGDGWRVRVSGEDARVLQAGDTLELDGTSFEVVTVPVRQASQDETRGLGRLHKPMRIIAQYDTVHLHRKGEAPASLSGISARIVSELVGFDGPVDWEVVAREIWRDDVDRFMLRRKWDVNLARLRRKLRDAGLRADLVLADGTGNIELLLLPDDEVEDRT